MKKLFFEWDENKNSINKSKHGVSFEEPRKKVNIIKQGEMNER